MKNIINTIKLGYQVMGSAVKAMAKEAIPVAKDMGKAAIEGAQQSTRVVKAAVHGACTEANKAISRINKKGEVKAS